MNIDRDPEKLSPLQLVGAIVIIGLALGAAFLAVYLP